MVYLLYWKKKFLTEQMGHRSQNYKFDCDSSAYPQEKLSPSSRPRTLIAFELDDRKQIISAYKQPLLIYLLLLLLPLKSSFPFVFAANSSFIVFWK